MRNAAHFLPACALLLAIGMPGGTTRAAPAHSTTRSGGPVKAVYQIDGGDEQALRALRNIRNHLQADPTARIVVVALAAGVDFLFSGEKDDGGYPFELLVDDLIERGVRFEVCVNTLDSRHIDKNRFIEGVSFVPSGFAELARLQAKEGFAYLKP